MSESVPEYGASGSNEQPAAVGPPPGKSRSRRGGSKRSSRPAPEGSEGGRPTRSRIDRTMTGYGDGIERAMCTGVPIIPPRSAPVQHRTGLAVGRLYIVAQSESVVLLCDGSHTGPHVWPNGDVVGAEPLVPPVITSTDDAEEP